MTVMLRQDQNMSKIRDISQQVPTFGLLFVFVLNINTYVYVYIAIVKHHSLLLLTLLSNLPRLMTGKLKRTAYHFVFYRDQV